jgi:hypothetical protein
MMLFSLKEKAKKLPTLTKLWMYPVAYVLTGLANAVVTVVDKFNAATFRRMARD